MVANGCVSSQQVQLNLLLSIELQQQASAHLPEDQLILFNVSDRVRVQFVHCRSTMQVCLQLSIARPSKVMS